MTRQSTGDLIVQAALEAARGSVADPAWRKGYALGQIVIAESYLGADPALAEAARVEIKQLLREPA